MGEKSPFFEEPLGSGEEGDHEGHPEEQFDGGLGDFPNDIQDDEADNDQAGGQAVVLKCPVSRAFHIHRWSCMASFLKSAS